jgi:hypothetical protein
MRLTDGVVHPFARLGLSERAKSNLGESLGWKCGSSMVGKLRQTAGSVTLDLAAPDARCS